MKFAPGGNCDSLARPRPPCQFHEIALDNGIAAKRAKLLEFYCSPERARERAEITNRGGDIKSSRSSRRLSQSTRSALGTQRQCRSAKTAVKQQGATRRTKSERASFFSSDPPRQELNYGFRRGWVIFRGEMAQKHVKNGGVGASLLGVMDAVVVVLRFVLKSRMPRIRFLSFSQSALPQTPSFRAREERTPLPPIST